MAKVIVGMTSPYGEKDARDGGPRRVHRHLRIPSADFRADPNSVICAFYDIRVKPGAGISADDLSADKLVSMQFTTPDLLNSGIWALVAQFAPKHLERMTWLPALEKADFVGATVRGSGIMMEFLDAFYGLRAWDDYADPAYFD